MKIGKIMTVCILAIGILGFAYAGFCAEESLVVTEEGNVGIGTETPGEKLEVNGTIKFTSDGSTISKAPRVIYTPDNREGCPADALAETDVLVQTFTLDSSADVVVQVDGIAKSTKKGHVTISLYIDGAEKINTLSSNVKSWRPFHLTWGGTLSPSLHTISIRADKINSVGCSDRKYGAITTTIFE